MPNLETQFPPTGHGPASASAPADRPGTPAVTPRCWICSGEVDELPRYRPLALYHCRRCDFAFQPTLPADEIRDAYNVEYFESYGAGTNYDLSELQRRHEARVRVRLIQSLSAPGRVLEIGSATGYFLSEAGAAGWTATGVEPCREVAEAAVSRLGTNTIAAFVEDVDFEPESFDVVCGWHVLEHIPDPLPSLEKLRGVLRPGGQIVFEVPNFGSVQSTAGGPRWPYLDPEHHVNQFTPRSLDALLAAAGFEDRRVITVPMVTYARPRNLLAPRRLARQLRYAAVTRTKGFGSHPSRFDLLRIAARAPAAGGGTTGERSASK